MTTSLPTTPSNEILPGVSGAPAGNAALADGLAALFAATPAGAPTDAAVRASSPEFTALLDGSATAATPGTTPAGLTVVPVKPASTSNASTAPRVRETTPTATATDVRGLAFSLAKKSSTPLASDVEAAVSVPVASTESPAAPALPDRATLEAIVALLAPLATLVAPEPAPVALGVSPERAADVSSKPVGVTESPVAEEPGVVLPARSQVTVTLPGQSPVALNEEFSPAAPAAMSPSATKLSTSTVARATPAQTTEVSRPMPLPDVALAAGELPQPNSTPAKSPRTAPAAPVAPAAPALMLEAAAEAELPDGAIVSLVLPATVVPMRAELRPSSEAPVTPARPENSAVVAAEKNSPDFAPEKAAGKNFLTTEEQELSPTRGEAGIGVAQTRPTMLFTPHDTLSAVPATVPALVSTVVAAPQAFAASAPAAEPTPVLLAASVAHRAVATVTSVVDAQAASKLQPVPSVQLKFKVGAEDLAVRVALRDGVVHTEFRTDSPELRAAIQQEWKTVTAQPESAVRFLEPIVAPASSSAQSGTNSFAQHQHQQSPGQSAAQQQHQQQQQQSRAAAEVFGSIGRSTPFQPREGGAASSVAPIALPTSVHLSAVA